MMKVLLLPKHGGRTVIEQADPFDDCTIDEIMAVLFDQEGAAGLKLFLRKAGCDRETLYEAAGKLEAAGLVEAAEIVRAAAVQAATRASVGIAAIMADDDRIRQAEAKMAGVEQERKALALAQAEAQAVKAKFEGLIAEITGILEQD